MHSLLPFAEHNLVELTIIHEWHDNGQVRKLDYKVSDGKVSDLRMVYAELVSIDR